MDQDDEEEVDDEDEEEEEDKISWTCRRNFLDLLTKFFGFVNEFFWIC